MVRRAGLSHAGDNQGLKNQDPRRRIMKNLVEMTEARKRVLLLAVLSFLAMC